MSVTTVILLLAGMALILLGSDFLVDGSSAIARRSGISEFVIGLTIVGIGTSMPEMVVSFISSLRGQADMSVGNIVGSNIFNTCLILGVTAVILPITITKENLKKDMPINIVSTLMLIWFGTNRVFLHAQPNTISRMEGILMLLAFALYMYSCFTQKNKQVEESKPETSDNAGNKALYLYILMVVAGFAGLIIGGNLFVDNATVIARHFGWSDKFIGITILAGGTSLPELATCVVAAFKKKGQLALGNIIGSNVSNILLILGGSALINPLHMEKINNVDLGFVLLSTIMLPICYFTFKRKALDRVEGILLLLMECVYFGYLVSTL